jgi:hypothetical protein
LSATSTIKGVTVVSLGTPGTNPNNIGARGSIHISTSAAADTSNTGSYITNFVTSESGASKVYVWKHAVGGNLSNTRTYNGSAAISDGDVFSSYVRSSDLTTYKLYAIDVQVSANGSSPSSSSSSEQAEAAAAAAAVAAAAETAALLAAAIAKAKVVLTTQFSANKPATVDQFLDAGYGVRNSNVATKVSAAILKLSAADRENIQKVNEIISREDFIDRVAVTDTRSTVRSTELVSRGLLSADNTYKYSVLQGLASYPNGSLDSLEKIETAIKEQIFKAEAPKRRLAEIKARIAARKK